MTVTEMSTMHDCALTGAKCSCTCRCCNGKCWSSNHPIDANHNKFEVACPRVVDGTLMRTEHRNIVVDTRPKS